MSSASALVPVSKPPPTTFQKVIRAPGKAMRNFNVTALFQRKRSPPIAREVYINTPLPEEHRDKKGRFIKDRIFPTNQNVTSKYTIITFLPRNLLEQFRRVANIFFLAINILQFFPKFSTISPGLVMLPLILVLTITAAKDGYEDVKRHQSDHKVNHTIVHVLNGGDDYKNENPMGKKSKTFSPAIPLPRKWSKKAKKGNKDTTDLLQASERDGVTGTEQQTARPAGGDDQRSIADAVSAWEEDPEAGDTLKELGWQRTIWEDVKVGDFVKIYENEPIPADVVICATSEEEDVAYVETKGLDGETNLKSRHGVPGLNHLRTIEDCANTRLRVDLEPAEVNMFRLNGAVVILDETERDVVHPIDLQTTLLRGCTLRNTAWIVAIVIFTGSDTKIIMNSGATPSKRSKVERQMNPQVLANLALIALVSMCCAIVDHFNEVRWYAEDAYWIAYANTPGDNPNINGLVTFANSFITFQNIVPISLYISIEFVRTCQALFIYWDHAIKYDHNGTTTRTLARSWNLSDDLGQIEYIFSDKTGTLTQNAMIFRQCSIGGKIYYGDPESDKPAVAEKEHPADTSEGSESSIGDRAAPVAHGDVPKVQLPEGVLQRFKDAELSKDLEDHDSEQSRVLHGFFAVLGLCHTVLAAEPSPGVIEYKAQSPDEAALVQTAADVGFVFRGRDHNILKLSTPFSETPDEYELLQVLEFNSARKRMSVVLRKMDDDGRIFLLVKGADNVIFERLAPGNEELKQKTDKDLQQFASDGLRTLCLAYRVLEADEYEKWAAQYHEASVSLDEREKKIEEVSASIETNLTLLGSTAIEDKLQDGVPETISDLKRAGIKIWVATGDKLETAVAIGYTTNLLTRDTNLIIVREGRHSIYDQLRDALEGFFGEQAAEEPLHRSLSRTMSRQTNRSAPPPRLRRVNTGVTSLVGADNGERPGGFSLVIDGAALTHAFEDPETNALLLALSTRCNTVVCCRVSPLQKAQIVHLIKDNLGVMCLAIGDGANDVSMIQAADVGVGISGEEGLQAVNSSDYAIAQFRYLKRLLLVHGTWSYYRNSNMILNFFYKNVIGVGVLFWFQIYCGWSTTFVFEYTYLLFWNVFWTLVPVIAMGLFDKNIDAEILMALPELYRRGRQGKLFGMRRFFIFILEGAYQSAVVYFFIHYTYVTTTPRTDGYSISQYEMSTTMAIAAVMVANLFNGLMILSWTWWVVFAVAFGPFLVWVYTAIYSILPPSLLFSYVYGNDHYLFRSAAFWFGWPFVLILSLLPRYLWRVINQTYFPGDMDTLKWLQKTDPNFDVEHDPALGGRFQTHEKYEHMDQTPINVKTAITDDRADEYPLRDVSSNAFAGHQDQAGDLPGRQSIGGGRSSMQSTRAGMGRLQSARGSQVDMATGLRREESRGFDFSVEEGGVAMARMQSRLSEASRRRTRAGSPTRGLMKPSKSGSTLSSPFSKMRERAGSILHPSRRRNGSTVEPVPLIPAASSPSESPDLPTKSLGEESAPAPGRNGSR